MLSHAKIRVRYAETDQMGVVYHSNYFVWFEIGRVEFLRQLGLEYKQMEIEDGCHIAVVDASCRYRAPARYDDELTIETRIVAIRRSVIKFAYRLLRSQAEGVPPLLLAEGSTTHVTVGRSMEKTVLPDRYAAALSSAIEP